MSGGRLAVGKIGEGHPVHTAANRSQDRNAGGCTVFRDRPSGNRIHDWAGDGFAKFENSRTGRSEGADMEQREKKGPQQGQELHLDPLDRSLRKKIPAQTGASSIFYTTRLCQRLVRSKSEFDLSDPNGYLLSSEYNSLHDPNLRRYLYRKDVHQRLTAGGFITKDNRVVCSLREMNRYKQHLLEVERDWARKLQIEKKKLQRRFHTFEDHVGLSELTLLTRLVAGTGIEESCSHTKLLSIAEKEKGAPCSTHHSELSRD
ncbi:hypothetical protein MHYP_G00302830 [Metynnis hypsauchen]